MKNLEMQRCGEKIIKYRPRWPWAKPPMENPSLLRIAGYILNMTEITRARTKILQDLLDGL